MLSAGPISHDSMQLSTTTTGFVALFYFIGYVIFVCALFLTSAESLEGHFLLYRRIHHVKFLAFHGNQLEYNGS